MRNNLNQPDSTCESGVLAQLPVAVVRLQWTEPWDGPPAPHLLRGAVAAAYPDNDLFHQHRPDGAVLYRYPRIHYRWDRGDGILVGFGRGVQALADFFAAQDDITLRLGNRVVRVRDVWAEFELREIRGLPVLRRYRFHSPWLPFSQENYQRYIAMTPEDQRAELDRLATANLLSAFKGLGIHCDFRILTSFLPRREVWCRYKNNRLLGFSGLLVCNLLLPEGFAIGRAVSHGYGWLVPDTPRKGMSR